MRLPAVAIAAAFACGIVLGLRRTVVGNAAPQVFLSLFVFAGVLILLGVIPIKIERLLLATAASFLGWILLGFPGVCIAEQPRDADHVISLLERGRPPLKTPQR